MKDKYKHIGDIETRTIEECTEVIHILCKIKRFGRNNYHPEDKKGIPNGVLLKREIKDLRICLVELENRYQYCIVRGDITNKGGRK